MHWTRGNLSPPHCRVTSSLKMFYLHWHNRQLLGTNWDPQLETEILMLQQWVTELQLCSTKCSLVHISLDIFWTAMRFIFVLFFSGTLKASSFQPVESQKERKVQAPHRKHTLYLWSWEVEILFCSSYCNLLFNLHVCHTSLNIIHNEFFQWHFFPLWCSSPWEKAGKTRQIGQKFCSKGSFG